MVDIDALKGKLDESVLNAVLTADMVHGTGLINKIDWDEDKLPRVRVLRVICDTLIIMKKASDEAFQLPASHIVWGILYEGHKDGFVVEQDEDEVTKAIEHLGVSNEADILIGKCIKLYRQHGFEPSGHFLRGAVGSDYARTEWNVEGECTEDTVLEDFSRECGLKFLKEFDEACNVESRRVFVVGRLENMRKAGAEFHANCTEFKSSMTMVNQYARQMMHGYGYSLESLKTLLLARQCIAEKQPRISLKALGYSVNREGTLSKNGGRV